MIDLVRDRFVSRLWRRDPSLWSDDAAVQASIRSRLGWLDAPSWTRGRFDELARFAESVRNDGFQRVVLLGMGGSSLAPEVLNRVCGPRPGWPRFAMLDSTDPGAIRDVDRDLEGTLFVLASKSGSTIAPNCLAAYFASRLVKSGIDPAERRLVDEPNVRQAKEATGTLLDAYKKGGRLPARPADVSDGVATLTLSEPARQALGSASAWNVLRLLGGRVRATYDYLGLLNYLPPSDAVDDVCRRARRIVTDKTACAVMVGYGPRYLHSTGQLHKRTVTIRRTTTR